MQRGTGNLSPNPLTPVRCFSIMAESPSRIVVELEITGVLVSAHFGRIPQNAKITNVQCHCRIISVVSAPCSQRADDLMLPLGRIVGSRNVDRHAVSTVREFGRAL